MDTPEKRLRDVLRNALNLNRPSSIKTSYIHPKTRQLRVTMTTGEEFEVDIIPLQVFPKD